MKRLLPLAIFLLLIPYLGSGQGKVKVFTEEEETSKPAVRKKKGGAPSGDYTNLISWNILMPVRGLLGLSYERVLTDKVSLEINAGATIQDHLFERYNYPSYQRGNIFQTRPGPGVTLSALYYPWDYEDFNAFYIGGQLGYKHIDQTGRYRYIPAYATFDYIAEPLAKFDSDYDIFDANLLTGVKLSHPMSRLTFAIYGGIGLRYASFTQLQEEYIFYRVHDQVYPYNDYDAHANIDHIHKMQKWMPTFPFGLNMGIAF